MAKVRLRELEINRVALVKRGSNPLADIVFYKHHPDSQETSMKIPKLDRTKLSKEQNSAVDGILKALGIEEVDIDPSKASADDILKTLPESIQKVLKDATDAAVKDAVEKAKKPEPEVKPEPKREDVLKELTPAARAYVEGIEKAAKDAATAAEEASKAAKAATEKADRETAKREEAEFAKDEAEPILKHYVGKTLDNGRLLYRIKKSLGKDDYDALVVILKSGNEALAKAKDEIGHGDPLTGDGSAYEKLDQKAKEMVKADTTSKLTYSKAFTKACQDNPGLHAQYNEERGKEKRRRRQRDEDDEE